MKNILFLSISLLFLGSCSTLQKGNSAKQEGWFNIAVAEDVEIFTDTLSIRHEGAVAYAREKRVYITDESRKTYIDKIRTEYTKMGKPEKADKWKDFSYCIYYSLYDCTNKRHRILSVEDYDFSGKLIAKTMPPQKPEKWANVDVETVADYTFFFVCDYQK